MSKPPFSKKRKGKSVDAYPMGAKTQVEGTKRTKRSRSGRPRKPKEAEAGVLFWRSEIEKRYTLSVTSKKSWEALDHDALSTIGLGRADPVPRPSYPVTGDRILVEEGKLTIIGEAVNPSLRVPEAATDEKEDVGNIRFQRLTVYPTGDGHEVRWSTEWDIVSQHATKAPPKKGLKKMKKAELVALVRDMHLYVAPGEPLEPEDLEFATKTDLIEWAKAGQAGKKYVE